MKHLRFILAGVVVLLVVCLASFVPIGTYASNISSTIWQVIVLSSIPVGASVDSTIHQVQIVGGGGGGGIPLSTLQGSQIGNFALDNGTTIISGPLTGDVTGSNINPGVTTLSQIQGQPLVGAMTANVAGQTWCTNTLNQYVPCQLVNDQGTSVSFKIDGVVGASATRWNVCPRTMRYAPGAQAASPFVASYGIAGGNPGAITTYKFQDAGTEIIDGYLQTTGVMNFGTPGCSPNFSGTQGGTAFSRTQTSQTSAAVIPADAASTAYAILACAVNNAATTINSPTGVTGWSTVSGGSHSGTGLNTQFYELNPIGANAGQSVTCNVSASGTVTAAVWTFKNGPASGEVVDAIAVTHNASSTTSNFPAVTPTLTGDTIFVPIVTTTLATYSAPPAPYVLDATASGQGSIHMFGGAASASASGSVTVSTASVTDAYAIALKSGKTSGCTLCTGGDKMEMLGPGSPSSETDIAAAINGVL